MFFQGIRSIGKTSIISIEISLDESGCNLAVFHRWDYQTNATRPLSVAIVEDILKS